MTEKPEDFISDEELFKEFEVEQGPENNDSTLVPNAEFRDLRTKVTWTHWLIVGGFFAMLATFLTLVFDTTRFHSSLYSEQDRSDRTRILDSLRLSEQEAKITVLESKVHRLDSLLSIKRK